MTLRTACGSQGGFTECSALRHTNSCSRSVSHCNVSLESCVRTLTCTLCIRSGPWAPQHVSGRRASHVASQLFLDLTRMSLRCGELAQLSLLICRICLSLFTCDLPTNPRIKSSWSAWQGLPIPVPDTTRSTSGVADAGCFVQKPITCLKGALEWNRGPSRPALEGGAKA